MLLSHSSRADVILLSFFAIILLVPSFGSSFSEANELIVIPNGEKPVKIDGMWTTETEWIDASETKINNKELTAYLKAKHDGAFVYILIDFISDQGLEKSGDLAVVCFDTNNNGGDAPLTDDYCFSYVDIT